VVGETTYFVQGFNAGNLKPDAPIACKTANGALRTAERLALSKLGVVAFSSTGDPEMGDHDDEPTVFFAMAGFPQPSTGPILVAVADRRGDRMKRRDLARLRRANRH